MNLDKNSSFFIKTSSKNLKTEFKKIPNNTKFLYLNDGEIIDGYSHATTRTGSTAGGDLYGEYSNPQIHNYSTTGEIAVKKQNDYFKTTLYVDDGKNVQFNTNISALIKENESNCYISNNKLVYGDKFLYSTHVNKISFSTTPVEGDEIIVVGPYRIIYYNDNIVAFNDSTLDSEGDKTPIIFYWHNMKPIPPQSMSIINVKNNESYFSVVGDTNAVNIDSNNYNNTFSAEASKTEGGIFYINNGKIEEITIDFPAQTLTIPSHKTYKCTFNNGVISTEEYSE